MRTSEINSSATDRPPEVTWRKPFGERQRVRARVGLHGCLPVPSKVEFKQMAGPCPFTYTDCTTRHDGGLWESIATAVRFY